jgi:hypothetical protein
VRVRGCRHQMGGGFATRCTTMPYDVATGGEEGHSGHSAGLGSAPFTTGVWGTHKGDCRNPWPPRKRDRVPTIFTACASRGVSPFQIPHTFSHDSKPSPLKNAAWRSSVWFLAHLPCPTRVAWPHQ